MKKKYINMSVIAFAITASIVGCGSSSKPAKTILTKQGVWERKGYGIVIKVDKVAKVVKSYDFTRETCLESTINFMEIQTFLDKAKLSTDKNTLESNNIVGITPDINISVFSIEALVEGRDDAIETALQLLN